MQTQTTSAEAVTILPSESYSAAEVQSTAPGGMRVIRRNGKVTGFEPEKISIAITKAFLAVEGGSAAASSRIRERVAGVTDQVIAAVTRNQHGGGTIHIEDIQDQVELALMRADEHKVARSYVLYREQRARERAARGRARRSARPCALSLIHI